MNIRKLHKNDFTEYKRIKLESLKEEPIAFDSSYEELKIWNEEKWQSIFSDFLNEDECIFYLAEEDNQVVAFAYIELIKKTKKNHIASFPTMYVNNDYRSQGIASMLLEKLIDEIRHNFKQIIKIQLSVYAPQKAAINLYKKFGFEIFGEFKKELQYQDKFYDQIAMELFLH
ncbi:MAG: GNAT family N-acetyltransferase [Candidatus Dojkabacteria bacterium]|nr:GNAT family N-acetyltransferase [Candidatus Dojkabacteria bacterium]MDQ7020718.1 GNAT family N-acetyltransferase [Candidatus Dojkabacteria bacterium]